MSIFLLKKKSIIRQALNKKNLDATKIIACFKFIFNYLKKTTSFICTLYLRLPFKNFYLNKYFVMTDNCVISKELHS